MRAWKIGAIIGGIWGLINFFPEGLEGVIWPSRFPPFPIDIPSRITHYLIGDWYHKWSKTFFSGDLTGRFDIITPLVALFVLAVGATLGAIFAAMIEKAKKKEANK